MTLTLMDLPERFASRVRAAESGCWEWQGWLNDKGYGYIHSEGRDQPVYRVLWREVIGEIPAGHELDHLCVNPACFNPAHLEPVTHAENQRRIAQRMKGCRKAGHDWSDPNNVRVRPDGSRFCAECNRQDMRQRYADKVAEAGGNRGPQAARTECPHGHPYDEANTYFVRHTDGSVRQRVCRTCRAAQARRRREARATRCPD